VRAGFAVNSGIALLSLLFSALLLMIMFNGLLAQHQALQGTLLGDYVLLQTAVPQIAGCIIALVLTFLSVADLLLLQVREQNIVPVPLIACGVIVLMVIVATLAILPAMGAVSRMEVVDLLRQSKGNKNTWNKKRRPHLSSKRKRVF
jgi:hypothetical protein